MIFRICTRAIRRPLGRAYSTPVETAPKPAAAPKSSCPADTVLEGLSYLKNQEPVLAKPDEEYPDWLWTILSPKIVADDGPGGKLERLQRRKANKKAIKERNFMTTQ